MRRVIIFAIGNELLIGETLDTNTNFLCRYLTGLGARVERVVVLPDLIDVVAGEVQRAYQSAVDLLITTGGLGPTDDDLTLAAIAAACELPLERNETAYQWIVEKYRQLAAINHVHSAEMNPAREKMSMMPAGATAVFNPVGAAPAMQLTNQTTTIISLPGVPAEMKAIVEQSLSASLAQLVGGGAYGERELWVSCGDESTLAPLLRQVVAAHPLVYVKSKAKGFGLNHRFHVILHARGEAAIVETLLAAAEADLLATLATAGLTTVEKPLG